MFFPPFSCEIWPRNRPIIMFLDSRQFLSSSKVDALLFMFVVYGRQLFGAVGVKVRHLWDLGWLAIRRPGPLVGRLPASEGCSPRAPVSRFGGPAAGGLVKNPIRWRSEVSVWRHTVKCCQFAARGTLDLSSYTDSLNYSAKLSDCHLRPPSHSGARGNCMW